MVTIESCEGERTETVVEETGCTFVEESRSYPHRSPLEGFTYAPPFGKGHQNGNLAEHP